MICKMRVTLTTVRIKLSNKSTYTDGIHNCSKWLSQNDTFCNAVVSKYHISEKNTIKIFFMHKFS